VKQDWVRPGPLRAGDLVAVVAPAGTVTGPVLAAGVERLESWDLRVRLGAHVLDSDPTLTYLAGTDADRAADLAGAWCDPQVRAVLAARGGYGTQRMLDRLDWSALRRAAPTLVVGSSDLTALHHTLGAELRQASLFGPMVATGAFTADDVAAQRLRDALFGTGEVEVAGQTLVDGTAHGLLAGGTLSLLVSTVGVRPPPPDGAILLLEDVHEEPYRVDHFLTHLIRAGWLDAVSGIALGSWENCGPREELEAVLRERLEPLRIPTVWRLPIGHCTGAATVPLGAPATLRDGTLTAGRPAPRR
jgi:muramoyltetrapeptide carboxypeptidase